MEKTRNCYYPGRPLTVVLYEAPDHNTVLSQKSEIRKIFGVGNHSIHITDNASEALQIAQIAFNSNSIDFLNNGNIDKCKELFYHIKQFKGKIKKAGMNLEDFIIDSSSVMELYGLRQTSDVDFLSSVCETGMLEDEIFSNHANHLKYYEKELEDLLYNPQNYLVFCDVKFITLNILKQFKANRREKKDLSDVQIIEEFQKNADTIRMKFLRLKANIRKKIRDCKLKGIYIIKKVLIKMGVFERIKRLLKK